MDGWDADTLCRISQTPCHSISRGQPRCNNPKLTEREKERERERVKFIYLLLVWKKMCRNVGIPVSYTHLDVYKRQQQRVA